MEPILNFAQLTAHLKKLNHRKRIAVVCANDPNTEYAISRALEEGIAEFLMIGDSTILKKYPTLKQYPEYVKTIHIENPDEAAREALPFGGYAIVTGRPAALRFRHWREFGYFWTATEEKNETPFPDAYYRKISFQIGRAHV